MGSNSMIKHLKEIFPNPEKQQDLMNKGEREGPLDKQSKHAKETGSERSQPPASLRSDTNFRSPHLIASLLFPLVFKRSLCSSGIRIPLSSVNSILVKLCGCVFFLLLFLAASCSSSYWLLSADVTCVQEFHCLASQWTFVFFVVFLVCFLVAVVFGLVLCVLFSSRVILFFFATFMLTVVLLIDVLVFFPFSLASPNAVFGSFDRCLVDDHLVLAITMMLLFCMLLFSMLYLFCMLLLLLSLFSSSSSRSSCKRRFTDSHCCSAPPSTYSSRSLVWLFPSASGCCCSVVVSLLVVVFLQ